MIKPNHRLSTLNESPWRCLVQDCVHCESKKVQSIQMEKKQNKQKKTNAEINVLLLNSILKVNLLQML